MKKKILVVDIGGTNVKLMISRAEKRKFNSGSRMTPRRFVEQFKIAAKGWQFDSVSIGFPAPVKEGRVVLEPSHLPKGWIGYDFKKSLRKPVRVINDAAMQALGSYRGGRMLFLGLGTGLGSALVWGTTVLPLELGHLPYRDSQVIEDFLGKPGIAQMGEKAWKREVLQAVLQLKKALIADYIVLGGGNAKRFSSLPKGIEAGHNRNAYLGGVRLWQTAAGSRRPKWEIV